MCVERFRRFIDRGTDRVLVLGEFKVGVSENVRVGIRNMMNGKDRWRGRGALGRGEMGGGMIKVKSNGTVR